MNIAAMRGQLEQMPPLACWRLSRGSWVQQAGPRACFQGLWHTAAGFMACVWHVWWLEPGFQWRVLQSHQAIHHQLPCGCSNILPGSPGSLVLSTAEVLKTTFARSSSSLEPSCCWASLEETVSHARPPCHVLPTMLVEKVWLQQPGS